jgi:hypothetical protein
VKPHSESQMQNFLWTRRRLRWLAGGSRKRSRLQFF